LIINQNVVQPLIKSSGMWKSKYFNHYCYL